MTDFQREVESFLHEYEQATNTHDFNNVRKLILDDAVYFFSDKTLTGIQEIQDAFEQTWNKIKDETYKIVDVNWVAVNPEQAVCIYNFKWEGYIDGTLKHGKGRGTNVLIKKGSRWFMAHEHLSVL